MKRKSQIKVVESDGPDQNTTTLRSIDGTYKIIKLPRMVDWPQIIN